MSMLRLKNEDLEISLVFIIRADVVNEISETLIFNSTLTELILREDFTIFIHCESFLLKKGTGNQLHISYVTVRFQLLQNFITWDFSL
jgi:hypothetical protein